MPPKHEWPSEKISPEKLLALAREASENAYVPYSRFHVGAAILLTGDEVIQSCNIAYVKGPEIYSLRELLPLTFTLRP